MVIEEVEEEIEVADAEVVPLLDLFRELTGITLPVHKKLMVLFRLRKRFAALGQPAIDDYVARVRGCAAERQLFVNRLTTNETSFFRTPRIWRYLREEFIPNFSEEHPDDVFRAWSAASSTGEEACSLAILCDELQQGFPSFQYEVTATDVDTEVLESARIGIFIGRHAEKFRDSDYDTFRHYLKPTGDHTYALCNRVREHIHFHLHNLIHEPQLAQPQDLVLLRNVLIYFRAPEQLIVLEQVAKAMKPGATLIVGESESLAALKTPFEFVQPQIYRKPA